MKKLIFGIIMLTMLTIGNTARAEDLSIGDTLVKMGAKEGVMFNTKDGRFLNTLSLELANYMGFGLNAEYIGIDGLGGGIDYDLAQLPKINLPVLDLVQYLHVGYVYGVKTITLADDRVSADNRVVYGPQITFKVKF